VTEAMTIEYKEEYPCHIYRKRTQNAQDVQQFNWPEGQKIKILTKGSPEKLCSS
jgi:hypothetical protein